MSETQAILPLELVTESALCLHSVGMMMGDPYVVALAGKLALTAGLDLSVLSKDDEASRMAGFQEAVGLLGSAEVQRVIGSRNASRLQDILVQMGDKNS